MQMGWGELQDGFRGRISLQILEVDWLRREEERSICRMIFFLSHLFKKNLFLAALGLRCCTRAFSSCSERGLLFVAVCGLLIAVASLVAEHGL